MNKLLEFLQEDNGGYSSMRLFSLVGIVCMATDWMYTIFHGGHYSPDPSLVALVLGPITAKVVQKKFEEKLPTPNPSQEGNKSVGNPNSEIVRLSAHDEVQNPKS